MKVTKTVENGITVINVDPGDTVLCDLCNKDYTNSNAIGGMLFGSKAVCPDCTPEFMKSVKKYNEEKHIKDVAKLGESFRNFVYRIR